MRAADIAFEGSKLAACARPEHRDVNFFPGQGESPSVALNVCAECPVQRPCLAAALALPRDDDFGVLGGTTHGQRRALRRARR